MQLIGSLAGVVGVERTVVFCDGVVCRFSISETRVRRRKLWYFRYVNYGTFDMFEVGRSYRAHRICGVVKYRSCGAPRD